MDNATLRALQKEVDALKEAFQTEVDLRVEKRIKELVPTLVEERLADSAADIARQTAAVLCEAPVNFHQVTRLRNEDPDKLYLHSKYC